MFSGEFKGHEKMRGNKWGGIVGEKGTRARHPRSCIERAGGWAHGGKELGFDGVWGRPCSFSNFLGTIKPGCKPGIMVLKKHGLWRLVDE